MNEEKAIELINKYQQGELTPEQEVKLNEWYLINAAESKNELSVEQMEVTVALIKSKLPLHQSVKRIRLWPRIVTIAAALVIVFGTALYFYKVNRNNLVQTTSINNDVAPGKVGATLTLANGKKIRLSDAQNGELAKEVGIVVSKTANGELVYRAQNAKRQTQNAFNTLSTANGETYQIILADGTKVWLNAASTLKYPLAFANAPQRKVELSGEGYFEVAKDKAHPFIVESNGQQVEVLGTHFNINTYANEENTKTTLLEGSVKVNDKILKPNEQAILKNNNINIIPIDAAKEVAWKNGKFVFVTEGIESIMRKLSRWYNIEVVYDGDFSGVTFTGSISRYDNITKILDKITYTQAVHFKITGRRVTVMP
jgi:transmembrane sensor